MPLDGGRAMLHFEDRAEVWSTGRFSATPLSSVKTAARTWTLQSVAWVAGVGSKASIFSVEIIDCSMLHDTQRRTIDWTASWWHVRPGLVGKAGDESWSFKPISMGTSKGYSSPCSQTLYFLLG